MKRLRVLFGIMLLCITISSCAHHSIIGSAGALGGGVGLICLRNRHFYTSTATWAVYPLRIDSVAIRVNEMLRQRRYFLDRLEPNDSNTIRFQIETKRDSTRELRDIVDGDTIGFRADTTKIVTGSFFLALTREGSGTRVATGLYRVGRCPLRASRDYAGYRPGLEFFWALRDSLVVHGVSQTNRSR